jgi:DNA primase catalytic subunit
MSIIGFYSRKDIQKEIVKAAKDREVGTKFGEKGFGKRPDIIQYESDVLELAKQGATSFHASEERWTDPLQLKPGMLQKDLDNLRKGWDFIIDIDCKFIEYSKQTANLLVQALKFNGVNNITTKFSGGTGIHVGVPFESFPENVHGQKVKYLFPEGARVIASYLKELIKEPLANKLLEISNINEISKVAKKDIFENEKFNPYSILEIDTVLISNRHMFRMPYSLNEKTNLISVPIEPSKILDFNINDAKIENVKVQHSFLERNGTEDAKQLIIQAFDWSKENTTHFEKEVKDYSFELPKIAIKAEQFPPCMKLLLNGIKEDGRKRSVFVIINFLQHMGWKLEDIEKALLTWNKKNYEPLREGYIMSQVNYAKKQHQKPILPPNCSNENYYKTMGICKQDNWCKKIKNPVNYVTRKILIKNSNKRGKK